MILGLSHSRMAELVGAVLLLLASIIFYRRKPADGNSYGNQGAVLLLAVAVIIGIHALGGLDYHPTKAEADAMRTKAQ